MYTNHQYEANCFLTFPHKLPSIFQDISIRCGYWYFHVRDPVLQAGPSTGSVSTWLASLCSLASFFF